MKTYVLTVSRNFPATHPKSGEATGFISGILDGVKIHTIRDNVDLWSKRATEINAGRGVLSIRVWSGMPYRSKQIEVIELTSIGIQTVAVSLFGKITVDKDRVVSLHSLSANDGLSIEEFSSWFGVWGERSKVIIHFTDFRY